LTLSPGGEAIGVVEFYRQTDGNEAVRPLAIPIDKMVIRDKPRVVRGGSAGRVGPALPGHVRA
jgi:hypothetical protein